ncbi:N-acetyltransferase [Aeoliella sp. ICT_H6.2]|uniref:N-acetyltransferase n=1 Tax=Aeoliella straminimaris TaxID=2954799 RepID=A0A9X2F820_9BACT|nr:N-acetyltransferase [Aeoliella straminimaris]MCO6043358.1 N-acetyltransferase [Aeoliella straminimaris]
MSEVRIIPVSTRREQREFVDLPWRLYRDDENWIPPLIHEQRGLLGYRRHPFYQAAEVQTFLAQRGGETCGRIAAIVNHAHNQWHKDKLGFFGFFESEDDLEVSAPLFEAAAKWLADRDMTSVRGPCNPSINYEWGLLVDGFDKPPMFMMTYNQPYYEQLIRAAGFEKAHDLFAFWGHVGMLSQMDDKHRVIDEGIRERFGITLRQMDRKKFRQEVEMFLNIYNEALSATWGFVPLSEAEVASTASQLRHMIVPDMTLVAEVRGKPIGVIFGLLDYNERIREINGRLLPFGFLKLLRRRNEITRMRVISANVIPEYQSWGVGISLARGLIEPVLKHGVTEAEFSWVLESNDLSRKTLEKAGAIRYKTYRLFERNLP